MTTVALVHGIGGAMWGPTMPALEGRDVRAWPLPGYAGSAMLPETTFPALAEALRDALDTRGAGRAVVLGHSIGGMVAQEFALAFPERVAGLVLYATTPAFGGRDPGFAQAFLAERLAPLDRGESMAVMAPRAVASMLGAEPDPGALPTAVAAMAEVPEAAYRATMACLTTFDRRAGLAKIAVPTLLVAGEVDPLAPARTMERMAEAIRGARLVVVPGAGHLVHLERPAAFNAEVRGFVEALAA